MVLYCVYKKTCPYLYTLKLDSHYGDTVLTRILYIYLAPIFTVCARSPVHFTQGDAILEFERLLGHTVSGPRLDFIGIRIRSK